MQISVWTVRPSPLHFITGSKWSRATRSVASGALRTRRAFRCRGSRGPQHKENHLSPRIIHIHHSCNCTKQTASCVGVASRPPRRGEGGQTWHRVARRPKVVTIVTPTEKHSQQRSGINSLADNARRCFKLRNKCVCVCALVLILDAFGVFWSLGRPVLSFDAQERMMGGDPEIWVKVTVVQTGYCWAWLVRRFSDFVDVWGMISFYSSRTLRIVHN